MWTCREETQWELERFWILALLGGVVCLPLRSQAGKQGQHIFGSCRGVTFCGDGTTSCCSFTQLLNKPVPVMFTPNLFPSNSASEQCLGVSVLREDRGPDGPDRPGAQVHGRVPNPDSGDVKGPTDFSGEALWLSNTPRSLGSPCSSAWRLSLNGRQAYLCCGTTVGSSTKCI